MTEITQLHSLIVRLRFLGSWHLADMFEKELQEMIKVHNG